MVAINPERLRAVLDVKDWSIQRLARVIGGNSQTLDNLCKGHRPKTTRQDRRAAIARALDVSEGWLAGTEFLLTDLASLPRDLTLALSPRMQLEVTSLLAKVASAHRRDRREMLAEDDGEVDAWDRAQIALQINWGILRLLRRDVWREQLTTWRRIEESPAALFEMPGALAARRDLYTDEEDAVGLAMVTLFAAVLRPWFEGHAKLDYDRLRVLIGYDRLGEDPKGAAHPLYQGHATSPLNLSPAIGLGWPPWVKR